MPYRKIISVAILLVMGLAVLAAWRGVRKEEETTQKCVAWLRVLHRQWVAAGGEVATDLMDVAEYKTQPVMGKVRWTGLVLTSRGSTNHAMLAIRPEGGSQEFIITQEGVVLVARDANPWIMRRPTVRIYQNP